MRLALIISAVLLAGCTDRHGTEAALEQEGYRQIEITGYRIFGCDNDTFHTGFRAVTPHGETVEGVACVSWLSRIKIKVDK